MNYHILINGTQRGPFTPEQLPAQGLRADTAVWTEGMAQWERADRVAELGPIVARLPAGGPAGPVQGQPFAAPSGGPVNYASPGYLPAGYPGSRPGEKKLAAGLCGIFLGAFGVHKFILGYTSTGVIMLCCSLLCIGYPIMHVIGLIEGIMYLTKTDEQFHREYELQRKDWF